MSNYVDLSFASFSLAELQRDPRALYNLSGGLLPEMAEATGYELSETPDEENLKGFIGHIGPAKTLQDNIGLAQEHIRSTEDAVAIASDWTDRSGLLRRLDRYFIQDGWFPIQDGNADFALITGGVARWMNRRAADLIDKRSLGEDYEVDKVVLAVGNRQMGEHEHELVAEYAKNHGRLPTETEYAAMYIASMLKIVGYDVELAVADSSSGEEVFENALGEFPELLTSRVVSVGNAPSALFTAGQFRNVARDVSPSFDLNGKQLIVTGDDIAVARDGQPASTHQNPFSALGQIARTALVFHQAARS